MKRKEREIKDREEVSKILQKAQVVRLAMCKDNQPYVVPLSYGYDGDHLYFHCASEGKKIDFLQANPNVCFEVEGAVVVTEHDKTPCAWGFSYESVIGYGTAEEVRAHEEKREALHCIMRQFSDKEWDFSDKAVQSVSIWKIHITSLTGKKI